MSIFEENEFNQKNSEIQRDLEQDLERRIYTLPTIPQIRGLGHKIHSLLDESFPTVLESPEDIDPYSLKGILSRIKNERAATQRVSLRLRFENIWRWMNSEE